MNKEMFFKKIVVMYKVNCDELLVVEFDEYESNFVICKNIYVCIITCHKITKQTTG